jgi:hypothetical protein
MGGDGGSRIKGGGGEKGREILFICPNIVCTYE